MNKQPKLSLWVIVAALAVLILVLGSAVGCNMQSSCPSGTVAEYDDDGWECEPDEDGNGVDDEEDD